MKTMAMTIIYTLDLCKSKTGKFVKYVHVKILKYDLSQSLRSLLIFDTIKPHLCVTFTCQSISVSTILTCQSSFNHWTFIHRHSFQWYQPIKHLHSVRKWLHDQLTVSNAHSKFRGQTDRKHEMWKTLSSMSVLKIVDEKLPPSQRSSLEILRKLNVHNTLALPALCNNDVVFRRQYL